MKQADLRDMFKKASKGVSTSTIMVPSDLISPSQSVSSVMKTSDNTEEKKPWWPWISRWKRYINAVLLWLVVQYKYRGNKRSLSVQVPSYRLVYLATWHLSHPVGARLTEFYCSKLWSSLEVPMLQLAVQNHTLPTASIQIFTAYTSINLATVPSCGCQINRILL